MLGTIADAQYGYMQNNVDKINSSIKLFWISVGGKEDIAYNNCQLMIKKFDDMNIKYVYSEYPGGHTWPVWRNNLFKIAPLLFK
jgi:enterochelin esterase-like enzyme